MILGLLLVLILLNGLFSMAETAVVSARKARLQQAAETGSLSARAALRLAMKPTRFLSTIQIGITVIGILSGAFGQATVAKQLAGWLRMFPLIDQWADGLSLTILVFGLTYTSLVLGELVPKRIALMYPEAIASFIAVPMKWLSRLAAPLVWLLSSSSDVILHIFGISQPKDLPVTTEELKVLIRQGADAGVFEKTEQDIVSNVFRMADRRASVLMTPRKGIVWINLEDDQETIRNKIVETPHSQYPVAQGSLDNAVGLLAAKDCLASVLNNRAIAVEHLMHKPLIVPESISTLQLLEAFRENPAQVALVADEYGSTLGLITQNELLESLVGELQSPEPADEPEVVQREDGSWLVNGNMAADDFRELLNLPELPQQNHYDTMAGFVLMQMQKVPQAGDYFDWNDLRFEVMDMDGRRIDKFLVTPVNVAAPADAVPSSKSRGQ